MSSSVGPIPLGFAGDLESGSRASRIVRCRDRTIERNPYPADIGNSLDVGQFRMIILKLRVPRLFLLFRVGCLRLLCTASVLTVLLAARLPLAADGPEGLLRETHWGESSSELLHTFGGEATRLPRGLDFGDSYADIVLTRYALGGVPMVVFFQMDKATHGLKRIQLERPRHAVNPPSFRAITAKLHANYGKPDQVCIIPVLPASGYQAAAEERWARDGT